MSIEQQVMAARSPRDALLILARAVDKLQEAPSLDSWDGWGTTPPAPSQSTRDTTDPGRSAVPVAPRSVSDDDLIAFLAQNYGGTFDPDDPETRGIVAQLRRDLSLAGEPAEPERAPFLVDDSGVSELDMAPLDEEQRARRLSFARDTLKLDQALGPHPDGRDWCADYAEAGPMFLYIPQRELLLSYPEAVRAEMIADLMRYDERVAAEVARDLLKRDASDRSTAIPIADSLHLHD